MPDEPNSKPIQPKVEDANDEGPSVKFNWDERGPKNKGMSTPKHRRPGFDRSGSRVSSAFDVLVRPIQTINLGQTSPKKNVSE